MKKFIEIALVVGLLLVFQRPLEPRPPVCHHNHSRNNPKTCPVPPIVKPLPGGMVCMALGCPVLQIH